MSKICSFGDVHFSSINQWNSEAGENFIDWFDKEDFGPKDETELVFVGDIAERDTNPGDVIDQMYRLFNLASKKAKHVYVCMGNHDKKLYHDKEQHSLKFLSNFPNITVYETETAITTENGYKVLMLPWQRMVDGITLHDYYNTSLPKELTDTEYDLVVGHWNIKEEKGLQWMQEGVDLKKFKTKSFAIGHIHLRTRDEYVGSVFPNSVAEQNDCYPRGYKVYENGKESFVEMPRFLKYVTIKYGESIPEREPNCAYAYVISECNTEAEAKEKYPEIQVRGIERPASTARNIDVNSVESSELSSITTNYITDLPNAFCDFIKETGTTLSRPTFTLIKNLLAEK